MICIGSCRFLILFWFVWDCYPKKLKSKQKNNMTEKDLKPFQTHAAGELSALIQEFPSDRLKPRYDPDSGELLPLLLRLKAITGAGKTPILALLARQISNGIILWTTNRSSVIGQTKTNLLPGGKYASLLPENVTIHEIPEMTPLDWTNAMQSTTGLTILIATVASFNQDSDTLRIHKDLGNGVTYWKMLGGQGEEGRQRPLYVYYDEGHGATNNQFRRLRDLKPKAFLLASASPLPDEFNDLLPGKTIEERSESLEVRTAAVPTPEVVKAGLLKTRLYLMDCNTEMGDAVGEANSKWHEIWQKTRQNGISESPIACFIVNSTPRGVEVWRKLIDLGVPPGRIAVHLNKAGSVATEMYGPAHTLIDTYKDKKSPEQLKNEGYTHLIWNLTLREGWDEPMAYVAYIDDKGKSYNDMVQKIGRFVRQPDAKPFDDPDLNSAYFFFNVPDAEFESLIRNMQVEMTVEGYELIAVKSETRPSSSEEVPVKMPTTLPAFGAFFGENIEKLKKILLDAIPNYADEALKAKGKAEIRVFNIGNLSEEEQMRRIEERISSESIPIFDFVMAQLRMLDSRLSPEIFHGLTRQEPKLARRVQYGSEAMSDLQKRTIEIRQSLNEEFRLTWQGRHGDYNIKPFKMSSPNIKGVAEPMREKYQVRRYANAIHECYNGMNPFEVEVATALDTLTLPWCRNPERTGYGIPIAELGTGTMNFYPDFLLWAKDTIWAIDPKGSHLRDSAVLTKLYDVSDVSGGSFTPVRVALILQGQETLNDQGIWIRQNSKQGYTLVRRVGSKVRTQYFDTIYELVKTFNE
jgi:type III restriction enzyme